MPVYTPSRKLFYYVYVLESLRDRKLYVGYTKDLEARLEEHYNGKVISTNARKPFVLIYFEGCINQKDAKRRENYLKSPAGRQFLGLRLREHRRPRALGTRS